ncbi:MAG: hypothetical protein CFH28_00541 [Alphaproteobacteria bacterium MarineAlpha6_Bin6]|nr:hypothetical protein [Pelagibacteraceae bacterium]PPR31300.1 MAG: hypothetical protein CFH28_00541 [Alphaproteobacteria bacterium MarineAlpha6_Bin6]PPR33806.1 MAG: hypothetical protein CFH27_00101 [Alphaproteobacteria bacterium MarineAlpha6_Bin5]|tara:strand:- start:2715 stop:3398 length:684 start_codon:yes stop_codon:yes gene_type:complete
MNTFFTPDLIFFVLVAAFLIIRLRSVLGRRTGNEKRPKDIFMYQDTVLGSGKKKTISEKEDIKEKSFDESLSKNKVNLKKGTALEKIYYFDQTFSTKKFLAGAKNAYQQIINSYANGEINKIKYLLDSKVFSTFSNEIKSRVKKKYTLEHTLISIKSAAVEKIYVKSSIADIVVKFVSEQVNLLKNKDGKVLKGNDEYIENHTNYWTFSKDLKSNDPNWKLIVTKAE